MTTAGSPDGNDRRDIRYSKKKESTSSTYNCGCSAIIKIITAETNFLV